MDNEAACILILDAWMSKGGHAPHYPLSWKGLYDLLKDIDRKKVGDSMMRDLGMSVPKETDFSDSESLGTP